MGTDVTHLGAWRKASRSGNNGGACVETAALNRQVAVRDSKDPDGRQLHVSQAAWREFAQRIRRS